MTRTDTAPPLGRTLTDAELQEARGWLLDAMWSWEPDDVDALGDGDVESLVAKHYEGGLGQFIHDTADRSVPSLTVPSLTVGCPRHGLEVTLAPADVVLVLDSRRGDSYSYACPRGHVIRRDADERAVELLVLGGVSPLRAPERRPLPLVARDVLRDVFTRPRPVREGDRVLLVNDEEEGRLYTVSDLRPVATGWDPGAVVVRSSGHWTGPLGWVVDVARLVPSRDLDGTRAP